jgi:mRNA interferase MazF
MKRGDIFDARLDPAEGSEQAGTCPVVVVSRDAINAASPVVIVVPCTTMRPGRRIFPSRIVLHAPDGGLDADSIALGEQVRAIAKSRLVRQRGVLSQAALVQLNRALAIALDLSP